jgi:hypothetical protein
LHERLVTGLDETDIEEVGVSAIAYQGVSGDECAQHLTMIGIDKYAGFHLFSSRSVWLQSVVVTLAALINADDQAAASILQSLF